MDILAKRLKWLREKERYSQKEVAEKISMSVGGYQKIEYGDREPKLDVLVKLCEIYDVSADFLLGRNNFVRHLAELSFKISEIMTTLDLIQRNYHYEMQKSNHLEIEIYNLLDHAALKGESEKVNSLLEIKKEQLKMLEDKGTETRIEIRNAQFKLTNAVQLYYKELLNIPESKPWEDKLLKRYQPYTSQIQMDLFDKYIVNVYGNNLGQMGYFGEFETEEEAALEEQKILKLLNG